MYTYFRSFSPSRKAMAVQKHDWLGAMMVVKQH